MAVFTPSPLFTDGAVLCCGREIRVFGQAEDGIALHGILKDSAGRILAESGAVSAQGRFELTFPPQEPAEGCTLTITDRRGENFEAADVAIGEVYLAGGQSNMELPLSGVEEGPETAAASRDPLLRFFNTPRMPFDSPDNRKLLAGTRWHAVSPEFSGGCSAAAVFFGLKMREKHPGTPVGIIACYWGGTSVTCWMDGETLQGMEEGRRYLREYEEKCAGKSLEQFLEEEAAFQASLDQWNGTVEAYRKEHPDAPWMEIENACGKCPWNPPAGPGSPYRPGGLAVHMLRPLAPVALTAFLYYQAEEDAGRTEYYDVLMTAMIGLWRRWFRAGDTPFLFVQLPMWLDSGAEDRHEWARTRLAQARVRDTVSGTGMICLLDQGEYGNIHPVRKRPVGERLAELACRVLYGTGEVSPRACGLRRDGKALVVELTQPAEMRDGIRSLLEIAGADGNFLPADGTAEGTLLRVWADAVPDPVCVRYAWTDYEAEVPLWGKNGLPAEPFRLSL